MAVMHPSDPLAVRSRVSEEEWQRRVDLAAAYRLVALYGWDDLVFTHLSARVPGPEHHFLINPYGMLFEEITASSLVKVDLDARIVLDNGHPVNPAGFTIHSAVHAAREDAACVLHIHSHNGIAVSAQREGLMPISQQALVIALSLGYHSYEGIALRADEKPRLVADLAHHTALILRNHGLLTVGPTVADAFLTMYTLEAACAIQIKALAGGGELNPIDGRIVAGTKAAVKEVTRGLGGMIAWPALLRRLDRIDPSYRA